MLILEIHKIIALRKFALKELEAFFEELNKDEKSRLEVNGALKRLNTTERKNEKIVFKKVIVPILCTKK